MAGEDIKGMTVTGRFFKRISKPQSDWSAQLIRAKNRMSCLFPSLQKRKKGSRCLLQLLDIHYRKKITSM